jgi:hypothetical protein
MGIMNLLKADWTGKVGQTVGAKWKNKSTIRTYTKPAYTNTPAQQAVRDWFKAISSHVALFSDPLKSLSALDTKGMSVRNAIVRLNKELMENGEFDPEDLEVSRGGLPAPDDIDFTIAVGGESITATWSKVEASNVSDKAKVVVIAVDSKNKRGYVETALNTAETLTISAKLEDGAKVYFYAYLLDYRGSTKVGSPSVADSKTYSE